MRRQLPSVVLVATVVALIVGGLVLVQHEANTRVGIARSEVGRASAAESSTSQFTPSYFEQEPFVRQVVRESLLNDAMPHLTIEGGGEDEGVSVSFGAFGTGSFLPSAPRPWVPRFVTAPLALGLVVGIAVVLVKAAHWTPTDRPRAGRRRRVP